MPEPSLLLGTAHGLPTPAALAWPCPFRAFPWAMGSTSYQIQRPMGELVQLRGDTLKLEWVEWGQGMLPAPGSRPSPVLDQHSLS